MKKSDRIARSAEREAQLQKYKRQEQVMRAFLAECRSSMTPVQWNHYYSEAEKSAGETMHIIEYMVFDLAETQTHLSAALKRALDAVIDECEIDRERWTDLRKLNYDPYWRQQYGYNQ